MPDELVLGQVSWSQVSTPCGYQLLLKMAVRAHERGAHEGKRDRLCRICQGLPEAPRSIALIFGDAWEAGIQYELTTHEGAGAALEHAQRVLHDEIKAQDGPDKSGVRWDDLPALRRDGQPYKGQENRMPTREEAENNLALGVAGWVREFAGKFSATAYQQELFIPLAGDFEGWRIPAKLDFVTDEGGFIDTKASGSGSWSKDDLDDKLAQLHIYHRAYELHYGQRASYALFHLLHTGSDRVEVIEVPYDAERIQTVLEDMVYPTIRAKQSGGLTPQLKGWHHSPRFCDSWAVCPHGARARGGFKRLEAVA